MLPAAETILAARRAMASDPRARATVGRVHARPGGTNIVPSSVEVWLDARGPAPQALVEDVVATARAAAAREGCALEVTTDAVSPAVALDTTLADTLSRVAAATVPGVGPLATGAGHDAGVLATHLPTGMLHVRNPTGISHAPDEHASDDDVAAGVRVLADVLAELTR